MAWSGAGCSEEPPVEDGAASRSGRPVDEPAAIQPARPRSIELPAVENESLGSGGASAASVDQEIDAWILECREFADGEASQADLMAWIERQVDRLQRSMDQLRSTDSVRRALLHHEILETASRLGPQNPALATSLLSAEAALLAGDSNQCLDFCRLILSASFGEREREEHPHFFSPGRWMLVVRASARAVEAAHLLGDFRRGFLALGRGRAVLDGPQPNGLEGAQRAAQAADLSLAEADLYRALGRPGDAEEALAAASASLKVLESDPELANPLRERWEMSRIDAQLHRGQFLRAGALAAGLLERMDARGASNAERATVLWLSALAELGAARQGKGDVATAAATLRRLLDLPGAYKATRMHAWLKLLEICLLVKDWMGARHCLDVVDAHFAGEGGLREAEIVALRAHVRQASDGTDAGEQLWDQLQRLVTAWESVTVGGDVGAGLAPPARGGVGFLAEGWRRLLLSEWIRSRVGGDVECEDPTRLDAALRGVLLLEAATTLARVRTGRVVEPSEVRTKLASQDRVVLVYLPARLGSHLFELTDGAARHWPLPPELELIRGIGEMVDVLRLAPDRLVGREDQIRQQGAAICERLLPEPLRARIVGREVLIVGAEYLQGLPFEALPVGDDLLGEISAISYLDSLTLGVGLLESVAASELPRRVALLACTEPEAIHAGIRAVPFEPNWAASVRDAYGGDAVKFVSVPRATKEAAIDSVRSAEYGIVHLVAHGVRRWSSQFSNGIALRDDVLWPDDLFDIKAQGLVIVSSCSAGRGEDRLGDSLLLTNLGGTLLWEGAGAVVLPAAPIPVAPHLRFMGIVHGRIWRAGDGPAAALMAARAQLKDDGGEALRFNRAMVQVHGLGALPLWRE